MRKRTYTKPVAGLVSLSALALGMLAVTQSAEAAQNIANTKHNLSNQRSGVGVNGGTAFGASGVGDIFSKGAASAAASNPGGGSDQICVFCHTPHGANTSAATVPLWNRMLTSSSAYKAYTMIGSNSTGTASVGGMSLACLSCHDGTQAMDAMFNAPGSGPGVSDGNATVTQSNQYLWNDPAGDVGPATYSVSTSGALTAPITMLGTDLSNDHPIGMNYCGGASGGVCADADFKAGTNAAGNNKSHVGVLKLFGNSGNAMSSTVECATCHDPHLEPGGAALDGVGTTQLFLRVSPVASRICLTCHTK